MPTIRRGEPGDREAIRRIQEASPGAAQWNPAEYSDYDLRVAVCEDEVVGFLVTRTLGKRNEPEGECEILNLAVAPEARRRGVGRRLMEAFLDGFSGDIFLEVRESNVVARHFYNSLKFKEVSRRSEYYLSPTETAIVMKFHSC
jgi:ribosomal-protein-alanine N-acetyltransferase